MIVPTTTQWALSSHSGMLEIVSIVGCQGTRLVVQDYLIAKSETTVSACLPSVAQRPSTAMG